jgi:hypothetical protein
LIPLTISYFSIVWNIPLALPKMLCCSLNASHGQDSKCCYRISTIG